ncbi:MAG: ABC transporter ATP-binding protein [Thermodesulfobacteriota bacterium]
MKTALEIQALNFSYREIPVLRNVSFSVQEAELFIIIGPNGSGKTTLIKVLAGVTGRISGKVALQGRAIGSYGRRSLARKIAYVPQTTTPDFPFTVMELVLMGRSPYLGVFGVEGREDREIARQALAFTGIEHLARRKLNRLSGGECQRVFIARAICQQPEILLLDEPTASLDLAHQIRIMDVMERLKQEKGVTIVMVSHDLNLAAMYGDRLLLLKDGAVAGQGEPRAVLSDDILKTAYGCDLLLDRNPLGPYPRVTPIPGKHRDRHQG